VRAALRKFHIADAPSAGQDGATPIGAVYALQRARPPLTAGITRPNIVDANLLVRGAAYRPRLVKPMDQTAAFFSAAAAIGDAGGVFQLTIEDDFEALDATLDALDAHWRAGGAWVDAA